MTKVEKNSKTILLKYIAETIIWLLLAYAFYFAGWTVFFTETGNGDNVEHIHSTWLVAQGKIPYRDFFQHHNPLLWYMFAPFIGFGSNALALLDMAHAVGIIVGILTFYVVYRISVRFFAASKFSALLSLLVLCPPYFYIYCFNFNPDTFMALFYSVGLYYLFYYWEKSGIFSLCVAFTAFFAAFLFTQKILMIYAVLGILSVIIFYKQKAPLSDIGYALLLPLCGVLLFAAFLYSHDTLGVYWQSNYPFNIRMQDFYGDRKIDVIDYRCLIPSAILATISLIYFFKSANKYFKIIAVLFAIELPLRCFYFAISPYYMLPLMIYIACLNSVLFEKIMQKCYPVIYIFLCGCVYYAVISVPSYVSARGQDRTFATYISQNVTPCDYILSSYFGNQAIRSKDIHYYWSMLGHIDIVGAELGIKPIPNLTELVIRYKPKFIYGGPYWNSYYQHRGQNIFVQAVAPEVLEQYYLPTPFPDFYILRYEYQGRNCHFNTLTKEWEYAN